MSIAAAQPPRPTTATLSTHVLGVACGLTAGIWLGAAEAPIKLVSSGLSPFVVSFCMVLGVFTARWSLPTLLKGTAYVFADLRKRKHLMVWAILAGGLWAVANTLTVFAVRDVGLAVAFPLWNTNSLIGLLWGRLLFNELKGAATGTIAKVVAGTTFIIVAATLLGFSTLHGGHAAGHHALQGVLAALGASVLWGTMYVPYRKAYLSGLNPLSFVTIFTIGEVLTMLVLVFALDGGAASSSLNWAHIRPYILYLFLGGFVWVIGDMFQQFAAKYLGIGRGIPLANTNQLWGLAWGALVFGELSHSSVAQKTMVLSGSLLMIVGALLISTANLSGREHSSRDEAMERECERYGLSYHETLLAQSPDDMSDPAAPRRWYDYLIVAVSTGIFIWLATTAVRPPLPMNGAWIAALGIVLLASLVICGMMLFRRTRFS